MDTLDIICIIIALLSVLLATTVCLWYRAQTKRTLHKLCDMLDAAVSGSFTERTFDESMLSALEAKLGRYLSECAVADKNLVAEKDKIKTLISDISHQTKTPIANILLYAQLLGEQQLPEDCGICVRALSAQAAKLNFLIGALVKASRLEAGIISVLPQPEPVERLLNAVTEQIRPQAVAKNIDISVLSSTDLACFDLKWTIEAVYNIVDNAVKYTPPGGKIQVKAESYELFCRIDITDNGIGIAEDEYSKVFTRFYRSPSVRDQEGVGIGLFLSREILAAQGGYIKLSSAPHQGSTFSVFLPRPA